MSHKRPACGVLAPRSGTENKLVTVAVHPQAGRLWYDSRAFGLFPIMSIARQRLGENTGAADGGRFQPLIRILYSCHNSSGKSVVGILHIENKRLTRSSCPHKANYQPLIRLRNLYFSQQKPGDICPVCGCSLHYLRRGDGRDR